MLGLTRLPASRDRCGSLVNKFKLRAEAGRVYSDDLELVFAELPKFDKGEANLATVLDRWFYFLKTAGDLTAIPGALQVEPAIVRAFGIPNKCGLAPAELDAQERREIFIQDQRCLSAAHFSPAPTSPVSPG